MNHEPWVLLDEADHRDLTARQRPTRSDRWSIGALLVLIVAILGIAGVVGVSVAQLTTVLLTK